MNRALDYLLVILIIVFLILVFLQACWAGEEIAWEGIVIHHSATEGGTVKSIDRYHKSKGWKGIGYHFVIYRDGSIKIGRDINEEGAHALTGKPYSRNKTHIGICLIGDDYFTTKTKMSVRKLCKQLRKEYPIESIERHHEECPGPGINVEDF